MVLWVGDEYEVITDQVLIKELDWIGTGLVSVGAGVKGFAASRGIARGPVRIIESAQDIGRVQEGDVLVAVMTRPDYLPAMKKAVAFVTDEGGVTCHAAIVAREMRKPCVIGTKSATKILKDGELVEVDADRWVGFARFYGCG
jgi:pyruvate,water dikinase